MFFGWEEVLRVINSPSSSCLHGSAYDISNDCLRRTRLEFQKNQVGWRRNRHDSYMCSVIFTPFYSLSGCLDDLLLSNVASVDKIESNDDRSLLLGFRKVLKGVCDGNFVLDSHHFTVVDDCTIFGTIVEE